MLDTSMNFSNDLPCLVQELPKHKMILISGDINAKIDKANYKVSEKHLLLNITNEGNISDRNRRFCK